MLRLAADRRPPGRLDDQNVTLQRIESPLSRVTGDHAPQRRTNSCPAPSVRPTGR